MFRNKRENFLMKVKQTLLSHIKNLFTTIKKRYDKGEYTNVNLKKFFRPCSFLYPRDIMIDSSVHAGCAAATISSKTGDSDDIVHAV